MTTRGLVLGAGGTVGGAWTVGAVKAIQDALGWDPRTADVIVGTSAGSTLATMLAAGVEVDEMIAAQRGALNARESVRRFFTQPPPARPRIPFGLPSSPRMALAGLRRGRPLAALAGLAPAGSADASFLDALVEDLVAGHDWVEHPALWIIGVDLGTGDRVAFGSPGAPRATQRDAVRASWAIPGWYPPVTIAGRRYVDGGAASSTSADLLPSDLDEALIIAPMASVEATGVGVDRLIRPQMSRIVDAEVDAVLAAGTKVARVHPEADELAVMGWNLMDPAHRIAALDAALLHVPARVATELSTGGWR